MKFFNSILCNVKKIKDKIINFLNEEYIDNDNCYMRELDKEDLFEAGVDEGKYIAYSKIKNFIECNLDKNYKDNDWILLEEYEPKSVGVYQVTRKKSGFYFSNTAYFDGNWYSDNRLNPTRKIDDVVAWMDLHKPYTGQ